MFSWQGKKSRFLVVLCALMAIAQVVCFGNVFAKDTDNVLIPARAHWRYHADTTPVPDGWMQPEYDDSEWAIGVSGFGYGDHDDRTVLDRMEGRFTSVFIRSPFKIEKAHQVKRLYLYMRYDDAFIVYINGREVLRIGLVASGLGTKVLDHEARGFEEFVISLPNGLLYSENNLIAIQGINRSLNSSDFSLEPVLTMDPMDSPEVPRYLTRSDAARDLVELKESLEDLSSYLPRSGINFSSEVEALEQRLTESMETWRFARLTKLALANIGDGHARVITSLDEDTSYLPFVIAESGQGFVALDPEQQNYLDSAHPLVVAIDDLPIEKWIEAASAYSPQASTQLIRYQARREMRAIDLLREDLSLPRSPDVRITLESLSGNRIVRVMQTLSARLPRGRLPLSDTRLLPGNIGYLRLETMDDNEIEGAVSAMAGFAGTEGLIIDVRDNRGGEYGVLRALYGYFVPDDALPYVTNIAAYRLGARFDDDHLHYRRTFRRDYDGWSKLERRAIDQTVATFEPEWELPEELFSEWHFMLLGRSGDEGQYHYRQPVAVLSNSGSYSATDGFLSAFADLPQVALIGETSAGASGASVYFELPRSGLTIAVSSAASFRPNGRLFDGAGVEVDIFVAPEPNDFIGGSDAVLLRARDWLESVK